jgi:hypothetical protein
MLPGLQAERDSINMTAKKQGFPASPASAAGKHIGPVIIFPAGEVSRVRQQARDSVQGVDFGFKPHLAPAASHCHLALVLVPHGRMINRWDAHEFAQAVKDVFAQSFNLFDD